jgi:hypothetical protein
LTDLGQEPAIFPLTACDQANGVESHQQALDAAVTGLGQALDWSCFETVLSHLTSLLHRFTACVPAPGQGRPADISLYDHLRTTAAIAACLFRYHEACASAAPRRKWRSAVWTTRSSATP